MTITLDTPIREDLSCGNCYLTVTHLHIHADGSEGSSGTIHADPSCKGHPDVLSD